MKVQEKQSSPFGSPLVWAPLKNTSASFVKRKQPKAKLKSNPIKITLNALRRSQTQSENSNNSRISSRSQVITGSNQLAVSSEEKSVSVEFSDSHSQENASSTSKGIEPPDQNTILEVSEHSQLGQDTPAVSRKRTQQLHCLIPIISLDEKGATPNMTSHHGNQETGSH